MKKPPAHAVPNSGPKRILLDQVPSYICLSASMRKPPAHAVPKMGPRGPHEIRILGRPKSGDRESKTHLLVCIDCRTV